MRRAEHGGIFFSFMGLLAFLTILVLLYLVRHPLLRLAGSFWVVDEPIDHADVIIVLGDDNYEGNRAARAAALFQEGVAPQVVGSGRLLRPYASIAEMIAHDLEEHGVPEASVIKFSSRASNTREEAVALRGLVMSHAWRRVVVVTSNYDTRRARFTYQRVFPRGIVVRIRSAADSDFDPSQWWQTRVGQKIFLNEVLEYIVARWELRHRYVPASSPNQRQSRNPLGDEQKEAANVLPSRIPLETILIYRRPSLYYSSPLPSSPGYLAYCPGHVATEFRFGRIPCGVNKKKPSRLQRPLNPLRLPVWKL